jgi:hypothetical protein
MEDYELEHIHDSLIDLLETTYPEKPVRKLIEDIFFLVHDEENLPSCGQYRCEWYTKQKEKKRVEKAKKRNLDKTKQICKIK